MKTHRARFLFVLALPLLLPLAMATASSQHPPIPAPDRWIAFEARLTETTVSGAPVLSGRYFQASNGSSRLDSERVSANGVVAWSTIVNTVLGKRFVLEPGRAEWDAYPLEPRKLGWDKPYQLSSGLANREGEPVNGMRTVVMEAPGLRQVLVPDLNFFAVWQSSNGQIRSYDQIALVEPSATLFEPPTGATVVAHAQPRPRRTRP
jgi:hypothetical protein